MEKNNSKNKFSLMEVLSRDDWVGYLNAGLLTLGGLALMLYIYLM